MEKYITVTLSDSKGNTSTFVAQSHIFKSGAIGYYAGEKIDFDGARYQVGLNITEIGTKGLHLQERAEYEARKNAAKLGTVTGDVPGEVERAKKAEPVHVTQPANPVLIETARTGDELSAEVMRDVIENRLKMQWRDYFTDDADAIQAVRDFIAKEQEKERNSRQSFKALNQPAKKESFAQVNAPKSELDVLKEQFPRLWALGALGLPVDATVEEFNAWKRAYTLKDSAQDSEKTVVATSTTGAAVVADKKALGNGGKSHSPISANPVRVAIRLENGNFVKFDKVPNAEKIGTGQVTIGNRKATVPVATLPSASAAQKLLVSMNGNGGYYDEKTPGGSAKHSASTDYKSSVKNGDIIPF